MTCFKSPYDTFEPPSLEDICIDWIANNLNSVICGKDKLRFRYATHCQLMSGPSEKLLACLCEKNLLNNSNCNLFCPDNVNLICPEIRHISTGGSRNFSFLHDFCLHNLSVVNIRSFCYSDILEHLNDSTYQYLSSLKVSRCSSVHRDQMSSFPNLIIKFSQLTHLDVSYSSLCDSGLCTLANNLKSLIYLNISKTSVTDISCLQTLEHQLEGLLIYGLDYNFDFMIERVIQMTCLCRLDISTDPSDRQDKFSCWDRFSNRSTHPYMCNLNVSGYGFRLNSSDIRHYIDNHPNLEFIGLACWEREPEYSFKEFDDLLVDYPDITIAGDSDKMLINTLIYFQDRPSYVRHVLCSIFTETRNIDSAQPGLLKLVLQAMRQHVFHGRFARSGHITQDMCELIVLAGTAVIYNLTHNVSRSVPAPLLTEAIDTTLDALEEFPGNLRIEKNCLITICNDGILNNAVFKYKRCCDLVFSCIRSLNHESNELYIKQIGLAVISTLLAEMSTDDLADLGQNMDCLLTTVAERSLLRSDLTRIGGWLKHVEISTDDVVLDTILRFALSALWNITDECPLACEKFVHRNGLDIYERMFKNYQYKDEDTKTHVYTKCLGLLYFIGANRCLTPAVSVVSLHHPFQNNFAEVNSLRPILIKQKKLVNIFVELLKVSHNITVRYFAAGIIAHLCLERDTLWKEARGSTKKKYAQALEESMLTWEQSDADMVAYRSFRPFETLVQHPESNRGVWLWALWAIRHVIGRKESRYLPLLIASPGLINFLLETTSNSKADNHEDLLVQQSQYLLGLIQLRTISHVNGHT